MPVMNFFADCKLLFENGKYFAQIRGHKFELSDFQQKALKQNGQKPCDIICGIRPQHITVGTGQLTATVEVSEMLGTEFNLHTRSESDDIAMVIPTVGLTTDVSMGKTIHFDFDPALIQLFNKESGNNLVWYDKQSADAPICKSYTFA